MSLVMVLAGQDGVVLAADSRTTLSYDRNGPRTTDTSVKLAEVGDWAGAVTYGIAENGCRGLSALADRSRSDPGRFTDVSVAVDNAREVFAAVDHDWSESNPDVRRQRDDVGYILGGLDTTTRQYRIVKFESPAFDAKPVQQPLLLAGKWTIAEYFVKKIHFPEATVGWLRQFAALLLTATKTVDRTVGGPTQLATITSPGGYCAIDQREVVEMERRNQAFFCSFRQAFRLSFINAQGVTHG